MQTGQGALLIGDWPHDVVSFLEETSSPEKKRSRVWSFGPTQSEYRVMVNVTLELIWIRSLLAEIGSPNETIWWQQGINTHYWKYSVPWENQTYWGWLSLVRKKLEEKIIVVKHISLKHQLADLLTKPPGGTRVDFICDKLGMYDIYFPAWGRVLRDSVLV